MLRTLRSQSKSPIFQALLWLLIFSFAIFGLNGAFLSVGSNALSVDGKAYPNQELINNAYQNVQRSGIENPTLEQITAIVRNTANEKAFEMSLENEVVNKGFSASDQSVKNFVLNDRQFWVNNKFDQTSYQNFLSQNRLREDQFFNNIRNNLGINQLIESSAAQLTAPDIYLDAVKNQITQIARRISVQYIALDTKDVKEQSAIPDDQVLDYYNKNKEAFRLPEYRLVDIFTYSQSDYEAKNPDGDYNASITETIDKIEDDLGAGTSLNKLATQYGGKVTESTIDANGFNTQGIAENIGGATVQDAINTASLETASSAILSSDRDGENSNIYVIYVKKVIPSKIRAFDDVKADIQDALEQQGKDQQLATLAQNLEKEITADSKFKDITKELTGKIITKDELTASELTVALAPFSSSQAVTPLFLGKKGDIKMLSIANNWYIFEITGFKAAEEDSLSQTIALQKTAFDNSYAASISNAFITDIQRLHKVKIKSNQIDSLASSLATQSE